MKQTAIEWLNEQMNNIKGSSISMNGSVQFIEKELNNLFEQAKAMEKQHIIDAYKQAHEDGYHFEGSVSDYEAERLEEYLAEQYYNKTFKSE